MENVKDKVEELSGHVKEYINTFYELTTVKVVQHSVNAAMVAAQGLLVVIFSLVILLLVGFGLGWWLGNLMNSRIGGFMTISGFYLICLILILTIGKKLIFSSIRNWALRKIYD